SSGAIGTEGGTSAVLPIQGLAERVYATWQGSAQQVGAGLTVIERGIDQLLQATVELGQSSWTAFGLDGSELSLWEACKGVYSSLKQTGQLLLDAGPAAIQQLSVPEAMKPSQPLLNSPNPGSAGA